MTLSSREASSQGLGMCVSVGIIFYSYVCEGINLHMTLSSGEASGQGLCMCVSAGLIFRVMYVKALICL